MYTQLWAVVCEVLEKRVCSFGYHLFCTRIEIFIIKEGKMGNSQQEMQMASKQRCSSSIIKER